MSSPIPPADDTLRHAFQDAPRPDRPAAATEAGTQPVRLCINRRTHTLLLEPRATLLDTLRDELGLTGTKKGCDRGQCGACTVLIDGRRMLACLTLAVMQQERDIVTIEGLAEGERLHPLQRAFVSHDALQCGYCTPGQICSAIGMLEEARAGMASIVDPAWRGGPANLSDAEIRERMSGNLCRCGAYPNIVAALREVARQTADDRRQAGAARPGTATRA